MPYNFFMRLVIGLVAIFLFVGFSPGQETGIGLLRNPAVRRDLGLSAKASHQIEAILRRSDLRRLQAYQATGEPPTWQAEVKRKSEAEAAMVKTLTQAQRARLRQIALQSWGATSFLRPDVAAHLGLSKTQRDRIGALCRDGSRSLAETTNRVLAASRRGEGGFGARAAHPEAVKRQLAEASHASHRRLMAAAIKLLKPAQRTVWTRMIGKPFPIEKL